MEIRGFPDRIARGRDFPPGNARVRGFPDRIARGRDFPPGNAGVRGFPDRVIDVPGVFGVPVRLFQGR
jgi:hypothetical protein